MATFLTSSYLKPGSSFSPFRLKWEGIFTSKCLTVSLDKNWVFYVLILLSEIICFILCFTLVLYMLSDIGRGGKELDASAFKG